MQSGQMRKGHKRNKGKAHGNRHKDYARIDAERPADNFADDKEPGQISASFDDDFDDDLAGTAGAAAVPVNDNTEALNELQEENAKLAKQVEELLAQVDNLNAANEALTTEKTALTDQVSKEEQNTQALEQKVCNMGVALQNKPPKGEP